RGRHACLRGPPCARRAALTPFSAATSTTDAPGVGGRSRFTDIGVALLPSSAGSLTEQLLCVRLNGARRKSDLGSAGGGAATGGAAGGGTGRLAGNLRSDGAAWFQEGRRSTRMLLHVPAMCLHDGGASL
ncbi:unnamed protein product, partial [Closterium sp. NIES-65]